jgi:exodeoxyribonuclease VII large subunit
LERGFALVKGADGSVRRRAAGVKSGEALNLSFADGEVGAVAGKGATPAVGRARSNRDRSKTPQGDLF